MKPVQSTTEIKIKVSPSELLEKKYLNYQLLSQKLGEIEKNENMPYKNLRNKFYNSSNCGKYNTTDIAGIKCIDIENPMKGTASLQLSFEVA